MLDLRRIFELYLLLVVIVSFVGSASGFQERAACFSSIEVSCAAKGGEGTVELPQSCSRQLNEYNLVDELDYVNNSSLDCSRLNPDDLDRISEPSQSEKSKGFLVFIISLFIFFSPLLASIGASVYYGSGKTEKLYLTGFSLLNPLLFTSFMLLIWGLYHLIFDKVFTVSSPDHFSVIFGGLSGVISGLLVSKIAAGEILGSTDVGSKRFLASIYILGLIFALFCWIILYELTRPKLVAL